VNLSKDRFLFCIKHDAGLMEILITDRELRRIHTCILDDHFINGTQVFKYYNGYVYLFYAKFIAYPNKTATYYGRVYDSKLDLIRKKVLSSETNFKNIIFFNHEICFQAYFCLGFYGCLDLNYKRSKINLDIFKPVNSLFKLVHLDNYKYYFYDSTISKHLKIYRKSTGDLLHLLDFNLNDYVNYIFFDNFSYIYLYNPLEIQAFDSNGKSMFRNNNKIDFGIRNLSINLDKRIVFNLNKDCNALTFEYWQI